jgi:hypothetical protein
MPLHPLPGELLLLGGAAGAEVDGLGRTAGEELLSAIEGRPSSGLRRLPCSLVLRESSRPRQVQGQPVSA